MEPPGTNAPELALTRTASRPTARDVPVSRSQPHGATRTHQVRLSPLGDLYPGGLVSQDTPTSPQGQPVQIATSSKESPATKRMAMLTPSWQEPAFAPGSTAMQASASSSSSLSSDSATSLIAPSIAPSISPSFSPSFSPTFLPSLSRSIGPAILPSTSPSIWPAAPFTAESSLQIPDQPQSAAAHMTGIRGGDVASQPRVQQIVMGAMARGPSSGLSTNMPAAPVAVPMEGVGVVPGTAAPPLVAEDAVAKSATSQSASAFSEPQQARLEPRQGMLLLDGAQLGRWVIDHLESSASRPGAMTTGIDPRMNATYPGAPTGT
jgi:hypothetical protein